MQLKISSCGKHGLLQQALCFSLVLLWPLIGSAKFSAVLQGESKGSTNWVSGNLMGWQELDYIPVRVYFTGGPATGQAIVVDFDHMNGTKPGIQNLTGFTPSSNVVITAGPTLSAPLTSGTWGDSFTVNLANNAPGWVEVRARLAAGAHLNVGSSLHLSGTPALGTLQIFKPDPGPGLPDLAIGKTAPTIAAPGDIITYFLTYTNKLTSSNNAVGAQLSDILPAAVTFVPGSSSSNAAVVGNTIFWDLGNLTIGAQGSVSYQVQIDSGAT